MVKTRTETGKTVRVHSPDAPLASQLLLKDKWEHVPDTEVLYKGYVVRCDSTPVVELRMSSDLKNKVSIVCTPNEVKSCLAGALRTDPRCDVTSTAQFVFYE